MGKASARQRLAGVAQHMRPVRPVACQPVARVSREESAEDGWVPSTQCVVPKTAIVTTPFNNCFLCPSLCQSPAQECRWREQVRSTVLVEEQLEFFAEHGFLCLPAWLPPEMCANVKRDMDAHMALREQAGMRSDLAPQPGPQPPLLVSYATDSIGGLTTYPPTMECIRSLMGGHKFALHHIHGSRMDAGAPASGWHQDYEQYPQTDRELRMIHAFNYIDGLSGEVGDLLLLPGSHKRVYARSAFGALFGSNHLPGAISFDNLPPGTTILAHSACLHGRRPRPGPGPRYFIDCSYCERIEDGRGAPLRQWCSYPNLVDLTHHETINRVALEAGHGRGGKFDWVFDTSLFYDQSIAPVASASHRIDQSGRLRRSGLSAGQAEAARAARIVLEQTGVAAELVRETATEGEVHEGGDPSQAAAAQRS